MRNQAQSPTLPADPQAPALQLPPHLEAYARIKGALLAEIPDEVVGFALVAVTKSGNLHWGADYAEGGPQMLRGLGQIVHDIKHYESRKKRA